MNDWDAVSNATPPGSAPDIWDAVSTPQHVTPPIKEPSFEVNTSPKHHQAERQIDERPAEAPAVVQGLSPDLAAAMQRRRRRQGQPEPEEEPQIIAFSMPDSESETVEQPLPVSYASAPERVLQTRKLSGAGIPALPDTQQEQPEEEVIATPRTARPPTRRKPIFLYVLLAALLVVVILGALVFKGFVSFPFLRLALPAYPYLSSTYQGTGHNVTYNSTGNLTLSSVIENEQGNISGLVTWGSPLCGSGYFTGSVSTNDAIRFTNITADGSGCERLTIFTGTVNTENNSMGGSYTTGSKTQIGTWQVSAIKATALASATAQAAATATAAQGIYAQDTSGTPMIDDPLSNNNMGYAWGVLTLSFGGTCFFTGTDYHISIPNSGYYWMWCAGRSIYLNNFAFQVQVSMAKPGDAGIVFGYTANGFYRLDMGSGGTFSLSQYRQDNNQSLTLQSGSNPAIKSGLNQTNVMTIIVNNGILYFYVNNQFVTTTNLSVSGLTYQSGTFGFAAQNFGQPTEIVYSNLKIWTFS